ncbi:MAG: 4Fe-4S binding protein [Halococcoides sp.]
MSETYLSTIVNALRSFGSTLRDPPTPRWVPDPTHRRYQRIAGLAFLIAVPIALRWPTLGGTLTVGCLTGAVGLGITRGRVWCDWMCPRGGFLDRYLRPIAPARTPPDVLGHPVVRLGAILAVTVSTGLGIATAWPDPTAMIGAVARVLLVSTLLAVVMGVTLGPRAWCRVCPAGTLARVADALGSRFGLDAGGAIAVDAAACVDCGQCASACRMDLDPAAYGDGTVTDHADLRALGAPVGGRSRPATGTVGHGDCLDCSACVAACPTDALEKSRDPSGEVETDQ